MADKFKKDAQETQNLNLDQVKDLTVEETIRKDAENKAGITEEDGVLDKYIKQNREQVESQKFENTKELVDVKEGLDKFIEEQRQGLQNLEATEAPVKRDVAETAVLTGATATLAAAEEPTAKASSEEPSLSRSHSTSKTERIIDDVETSIGLQSLDENDEHRPFYKKVGAWLGLLGLLLLGGLVFLYFWLQNQNASSNHPKNTVETTTVQTSESTDQTDETKALKVFNDLYGNFFVDKEQTKPKNSEFGKLADLEKALKALEDTDSYKDAKTKYDRLNKSISAINAVNDKFESAAIIDGEKSAATVKKDANFDDLSSDALTTGNASLDTLLQGVVTDGRKQVADSAKKDAPSASTPASEANNANNEANASAPATGDTAAAQGDQAVSNGNSTVSNASGFGITNYDANSLERGRSRVPYNADMVADSNNPAWTFNDGVLERIVATSQARGYITGNNYILEKVNIINGNGYYNMYKPDGTYLFSINCKTGFFVGNAPGHSDNLDF